MVGFFERLFGRNNGSETKPTGSGKLAKDRLQFVLVQDRINLPSEKMQAMKKEILEVISKYVTVDLENVDFALSNRERSGLLIAEIPFLTPEDPTSEDAPAVPTATPEDADAKLHHPPIEDADEADSTEIISAIQPDHTPAVTDEDDASDTDDDAKPASPKPAD